MSVQVKTVGKVTVVELHGQIDGRTAPQIQTQISPLIEPGGRVVVDMTHVTYLSSAGLRLLATMQRKVSEQNGKLVLAGLSERARDTMSITGFLPFFTAYDTVEAGVADLQ